MLIETYFLIASLVIGILAFATAIRVAYRQNEMFDEIDDLQIQINFLNNKIEEIKQLEQITTDF